MGLKLNPLTAQFDLVGSGGGGGASYIDGEVQNFSALPETLGSPAVDSAYLVREAEGTWLLNRKPAGIYIRTANTGTRASDWTYAGEFPDVFSDANFVLYDNGDSTRNLQFQLSGIDTATTRTLTAPNASGTIARTEDFAAPPAIGNTTPNSGAFTTLNSTVASGSAITATDTNATADFNNLFEAIRGSTSVFLVRDDGVVTASAGVNASTNAALVTAGGGNGGVRIRADYTLHWVSTGFTNTGTPDTFLRRDGQANTLAMYNSTNPQTFRLYNTYTSATNFERLAIEWSSNVVSIKPEAGGGGGTVRELHISGLPTANPGPGILWNNAGTVEVGT